MGKFFSLESPLMVFLGKMADLMWLNILTIVCCIPIVTAGASLTALHYVCLKIVRDEECYITRAFFHSFRDNFRQSTLLWLLTLLLAAILGFDFFVMASQQVSIPNPVRWGIVAIAVLVLMVLTMVFPVQAKFVNPIKGTLKTAFTLAVLQFPKVLLSVVCYCVPWVLAYLSFSTWPVALLFGISLPAFISALLYNKRFRQLEERFYEEHASEAPMQELDDGERIFSDELLLKDTADGE